MSEVETGIGAPVLVEIVDAIGWVRLNRPRVYNAIDTAMRQALVETVRRLDRDGEVRCVVVTGNGKAFCAGADLNDLGPGDEGSERTPAMVGHTLRTEYAAILQGLRTMAKPVIAGVNGPAAGIGASLAMAADIRIATPEAYLLEAFINIGLVPDGGATWLLPRLVGPGRALEMMFTGKPMGATDCERFGVFNRVVEPAAFDAELRRWAETLAAQPTWAIGATKRAVNQAMNSTYEEAVEFESYLQEVAFTTQDHAEGVAAFRAKRRPEFSGR